MDKKFLSIVFLLSVWFSLQAQDLTAILRDVEKGNLTLQAARGEIEAARYDNSAANALAPTSVEYSPFFGRGAGGVASSELIVSQEFDFPTLYVGRKKVGNLRQDADKAQYATLRRNILLAAKQTYLDIVFCRKMYNLLYKRNMIAVRLMELVSVRQDNGTATALDVNRTKMELMDLVISVRSNKAEKSRLLLQLSSLCGVAGDTLSLSDAEYPALMPLDSLGVIMRQSENDTEVKAANALLVASHGEVGLARQEWIPKITAGYRRNTEMDEAVNGFLVGLSFPLYATGKQVKAARARNRVAEIQLEDKRIQVANEAKASYQELCSVMETLQMTDIKLLDETLGLMQRSVELGQMSITDYYIEADKIYQKYETYLTLENRMQKAQADLLKNSL